jgi:hypothetical protein
MFFVEGSNHERYDLIWWNKLSKQRTKQSVWVFGTCTYFLKKPLGNYFSEILLMFRDQVIHNN